MALLSVKTRQILGSSPDGRVVDFGCQDHFSFAKVKCPEFHVTSLEACQDSNFFCEAVSGQWTMQVERNHAYYAQVQGHMVSAEHLGVILLFTPRRVFQWKESCLMLLTGQSLSNNY